MKQVETSLSVERIYLEGLLRAALGDETLHIEHWETKPLLGGLEFSSAVYRLHGIAEAIGGPKAWSLILKIIHPDAQFDEREGYRYWKREAEAYRSGRLQKLPEPLSAPGCYAVQENPDGVFWIWLEDVRDDLGSAWTVEHYGVVARQLGQFNGAYLAGQPLPQETWITHDWLRKYLAHAAPMVEFIRQNPFHPVVQKMLPGLTLEITLAVWDEHIRMLKELGGLPQTFCHQDAFERNLFSRGDRLVGIDWGYAGMAPLGAELAPLVGVASTLANIPSNQLKQLDQVCFKAYLQGLRDAGWMPDARKVRLGYTVTVLLRYILGATVGEVLPAILQSEELRQKWAESFGVAAEKVDETDAGVAAYYQSVTIEALKLLGVGSLLRVIGGTIKFTLGLRNKRLSKKEDGTHG